MEKNQSTILKIENLSKSFDTLKVINHINFEIKHGDFVTLLGPSGCGKTTTLRLIAGLEEADTGNIILDGVDITNTPVEKRKVNTVFQNYALFPHMNVYDNIAYGLKIRNVEKSIIEEKVNNMLYQVQMNGYEKRMPNQLSGGQRQRIAIARALVNEPDVLLLDEPLGALDLKLRQHMQTELKAIQEELEITFIYVTHDQDEALNMSDKLIIMDHGNIMQMGSPIEVYNNPKNNFVAEFVGDRNIIRGKFIKSENDISHYKYGDKEILAVNPNNIENKDSNLMVIHSDKIILSKDKPHGFYLEGKVINRHYAGFRITLDIKLNNGDMIKYVDYTDTHQFCRENHVYIHWKPEDMLVVEEVEELEFEEIPS